MSIILLSNLPLNNTEATHTAVKMHKAKISPFKYLKVHMKQLAINKLHWLP